MFIFVRKVDTVNFCMLHFALHQKIARRDFKKLDRTLLNSLKYTD